MIWKTSLASAVYTPPCMLGPLQGGAEVIFGSQDGCLYSLDGGTGRLLWSHPAAHGDSAGTGASVRASVTAWSEMGSSSAVLAGQAGMRSGRAVSCASSGAIGVLGAREHEGCVVLAACQLGSDAFSAPLAFGPFILCGCRDDHLYCLRMTTV